MDDSDLEGVSLVAKAIAGGGAVVVGLSGDPGTAIALGASAPVIDQAINKGFEWVRGRRAGALNEAAAVTGGPVEDIVARLLAGPSGQVLLNTAMEAVTSSAWDAHVKTMGRALANGALAEDDALVDEETYWARIMRQLEAPHLRIINHLVSEDPDRPGHRRYARRDDLADISGFRGLIGHTLATLEQNALISRTNEADELAGAATFAGSAPNAVPVWVAGELAAPCHQRFLDAGVVADSR